MACVPDQVSSGLGPQKHLNELVNMIATLRGGEARYLPLLMAKIQDELPSILMRLPPSVISQAAAGPIVNGAAYGPLGGINGRHGLVGLNGTNGLNGALLGGIDAAFGGEPYIKQELHSGSGSTSLSGSESGSPFGTPPVMHYYPLAR